MTEQQDTWEPEDPVFLLVREFDWWWTHRCERSKARDIVRYMVDSVRAADSTVTGVLYVEGLNHGEADRMAIKLNRFGWGEDKTYDERRRAAELARERR